MLDVQARQGCVATGRPCDGEFGAAGALRGHARGLTPGGGTQVDVYNNMGDLWRAQGMVGRNEAQRCYGQALQVSSGYAPAWRGLADLLREAGDFGSAVACYQARRRPFPPGWSGGTWPA